MITSACNATTLQRQQASSPVSTLFGSARNSSFAQMIASITACANLTYIKIGGVALEYQPMLFAALAACPKLTHFAYRSESARRLYSV
jgi:hypothetical protein